MPEIDCAAPMGRGAAATLERMAASVELLGGGPTELRAGGRSSSWRGFAGAAGAIGQRAVESNDRILQPARPCFWS